MSEFEGKVVIVTGGGAGLGRSHALEFAARGAKVVVNDLGCGLDGNGASESAAVVVAEIKAKGGQAIANAADVSSIEGANSVIADAVNAFGTLDIVVNNAGSLRDKSFKNMSASDYDFVLDVHLRGSGYIARAAWPILVAKNWGRIVFTSSISGIHGNFGQANYGAAKMGMVGLMNVLAIEGAAKNVRVNCLAPEAATRMTASVPGANFDGANPPFERGPAMVTPAVLYMCSENAPTGYIIHAANGRFWRSQVFTNEGIALAPAEATYENLVANIDKVLDMSTGVGRNPGQKPGA